MLQFFLWRKLNLHQFTDIVFAILAFYYDKTVCRQEAKWETVIGMGSTVEKSTIQDSNSGHTNPNGAMC